MLRPFKNPSSPLSNLLSVSLSAQIATAPIIAASFGEVSVIGVLTNMIAVPISGPILTLGLLGALAGNVAPVLAYPLNASNGFLVALLEWVAQIGSAFPYATVATSGVTLPLIWLFYAGCVPAAIAERAFPEERWALWAARCVDGVVARTGRCRERLSTSFASGGTGGVGTCPGRGSTLRAPGRSRRPDDD